MGQARLSTIDDLLAITHPSQQPIVQQLRAIILEIHPDACEVVRLGDRAVTYGVGPKKMHEGYAYILPYPSWVNLGFYQGVALPDPEGMLIGTGVRMRHVQVRSRDDAERSILPVLIAAALAERKRALGH